MVGWKNRRLGGINEHIEFESLCPFEVARGAGVNGRSKNADGKRGQ